MSGHVDGVKEGDVLAGKYRVDRVIGVGGMGVVVAAHHLQLDDRVAIKFLLPETLSNKDAVARFAREARAAVKIKSEHVARVTDVGTLENGAPFMVMEYLEGGDLSDWVAQRGALPVEQAVDFLLQAAEAIAEAHAIGIVHRDLKPANLFVARLPGGVQSVKVLDFGISKLTGLSASGGESSATKTSALMGSPLYMSPEQMQSSKSVDARGDLWALGVILYELVTGVSPFIGETMPELILKIMSAAPTSLRDHRQDVPEGLERVIQRCLEKDREQRYQSVGELASALLPFGSKQARSSVDRISQIMQAAGMSASAMAPPPSSSKKVVAGGETAGAFGGTTPGGGRARPVMLVAGVLVVLVGVGAMVLRGGHSPAPGPAAAAPVVTPAAVAPAAVTPPTVAAVALPVVHDVPVTAPAAPAPVAPSSSATTETAPITHAVRASVVRSPPPRAAGKPSAGAAPTTPSSPAAGAAAAAPSVAVAKKPSVNSLIDDRR